MPVVVGLLETAAGWVQMVLQDAANQLALNAHETTLERLKITAEILGADDQNRGSRP